MSYLWQFIKPDKHLFWLACVFAVLYVLVMPARPYLVQVLIDRYVLSAETTGTLKMGAFLMGVVMAESLLKGLFIYFSQSVGFRLVRRLRQCLYEHLLSWRLSAIERTPKGILITRLTNDVEAVRTAINEDVFSLVGDLFAVVVLLVVMFLTDWRLALLSVAGLPLMLVAVVWFQRKVRDTYSMLRRAIAILNAYLEERIPAIDFVQIHRLENREMQRFDHLNEEQLLANLKAVHYYALFFSIVEVILAVALAVLIGGGSWLLLGTVVTPGKLISFIIFMNMLLRPLRFLADKFNTIQMGIVASARIKNLLEENNTEHYGTLRRVPRGRVTFKEVWFRYEQESEWVLQNVSFTIEAGEKAMLIGASGAGKTSIVMLIAGFYSPHKGTVMIDNIPVHHYHLPALRSQIGILVQEPQLFDGTFYENITCFTHSIHPEQILEVAHRLGLLPLLKKLPQGLHTPVHNNLSTGEQQVIGILRTALQKPPLIIADEAFSSLSPETEKTVMNAILTMAQDATLIYISHRHQLLNSVTFDRYLLVEDGTVKELSPQYVSQLVG